MPAVRQRPTRDYGTGITTTKTGFRVYVRVKGTLYPKRFPKSATATDMKDWRAAKRVEVLTAHKARTDQAPARGSFGADVQTYLAAVKAMPTYVDRARDMAAWTAALPTQRSRDAISSAEVRAVLQDWRLTGKTVENRVTDDKGNIIATSTRQVPLSESACNHRRTALMHFYTVLNGKSGYNPVRDVPKFREPDPEPRGVPFSVLQEVFAAMPETATKARVLVLATTGLPPSTLMRLTPASVNYQAKTLTAPRRRKGKGTKTRTLPLSPDALAAFKLLTRYDGWGPFSKDSLRHSLHRACVTAGVPKLRAYDLRHSFATAAYQASGDIRAVQALLDHSDQKLTDRYALGAFDPRMRSALTALRKVTGRVTGKRKSA